MKKRISIILACLVAVSGIFAACSSKQNEDTSTTKKGEPVPSATTAPTTLAGDEFVLDSETVTDAQGNAVTNSNGTVQTTIRQYHVVTDAQGNSHRVLVDDKGNDVTDKSGNYVTKATTGTTVKVSDVTNKDGKPVTDKNGNKKTTVITQKTPTKKSTTEFTTESTSEPTSAIKGGGTTSADITTLKPNEDNVPKTSAKGKEVEFSAKDQQTVQNMLEVPALYNANYENSDGVPINIAAHVAIWMAHREGLNTTTYASGTVVLDLFKYFGQTVVNFKSQCNSKKDSGCGITYNTDNDSFTIQKAEAKKQTVKITSIQHLGNNNYYKVTGTVTGAGSKNKVVAIIQKNKLDSSLGFSVKALKWS